MSFWSKIFTPVIPDNKSKPLGAPWSFSGDKIFSYLGDLINRKDLASDCFSSLENISNLSENKKLSASVKTYFCFEKFITENKPLIVKKELDRESLRKELGSGFADEKIPDYFKIVFSSELERTLRIFNLGTSEVVDYAISGLGIESVKRIFKESVAGNVLRKFISFDDNRFSVISQNFLESDSNNKEVGYLLKNLFSSLVREIGNRFGPRVSEEIISRFYSEFSEIYPFEFQQIYLGMVPDGILEKEKIGLLARGELEKRLADSMSEEVKKRETVESLASELQKAIEELNASKAATINLLEDINLEKSRVEEEVEKRTKQLKEETALLRSTVESLPLAFFSVDRNLNIIEQNKILSKIFSLTKIERIEDIDKVFPSSFVFKDNCLKVFGDKKPLIFKEIRFDNRSYKIYLVPVQTESEEIIGVLGLLEDITEQKAIERSRDEFFSIASHELRTPLTAIRGNASMILEFFLSSLPSKDVEQMVKDIHDASIRLIQIVGDFLDVSRLEQEKIVFKKEVFDLGSMAGDLVREFNSAAILKGLEMVLEKDSSPSFLVYADKDRTKQILTNLVSNAFNYTSKGKIKLTVKKEGPNVSVYVSDTGVGISKENQVLLFRKFQQAQEKILTRDVTRSTGLGLYISKLLSDSMGGKLELVNSELGGGSTFRLSMPEKL